MIIVASAGLGTVDCGNSDIIVVAPAGWLVVGVTVMIATAVVVWLWALVEAAG